MKSPRKKLTRRAAIASAALGAYALADNPAEAAQVQPRPVRPEDAIPTSGRAGPGLEPFDNAMRTIIDRHGLAARRSPSRKGRLVLAKGYGWANLRARKRCSLPRCSASPA